MNQELNQPLISVLINGDKFEYSANVSLAQALQAYKTDSTFACAVNGQFVGKDEYQTTLLKHNDSIDVLVPIVGG